jgi:hypothetical protein
MSHQSTGSAHADQAMRQAHGDAMSAPKRPPASTRKMPAHGGRKASTGRRV